MAAVKAPSSYGAQASFPRPFSPIPDSPWPNSAMTPSTNAAHGNIYEPSRFNDSQQNTQPQQPMDEDANTPSDITAPSPSTSETSTVFTDVDGDEEPRSAQTDEEPPALEVDPYTINRLEAKSPGAALKLDTIALNTSLRGDEEEPPQSVIHIPSGFGRFHMGRPSRLSQSHSIAHSRRSLSQSSTASARSSHTEPAPKSETPVPPERPTSAATNTTNATESTVPSESTLRAEAEQQLDADNEQSFLQMMASPLNTLSSKDWASTPRAQTRQELSFSRPGSSLASIREGEDDEKESQAGLTTDASDAEGNLDTFSRKRKSIRKNESEVQVQALEDALAECWTLCKTLQSLSDRQRDKIFSKAAKAVSSKSDSHEKAWKACWKLCQNLYEAKDVHAVTGTKTTLSLCREFCQSLFEVRIKKDDAADSVLRVSFELNNHLFNTHDRTLPEAFRERTLDFYITLCHRLMKQKSKMAQETDALLRACWTLAEMLFSIRQTKRENRKPDQELLGSAMQACWDLCDLFREGWTQVRPDRGTPKASQATFSQAFQLAKRQGYIEDQNSLNIPPETPTTIFDDTATISPEEAPVPTISVMNNGIPQSARTTASAPLPRPNTTQRVSRTAMARHNQAQWPSINEMVAVEDPPTRPTSALSQSSQASSAQMSLSSSLASSQHTVRTPSEDPSLTLLKALFVRAAVQTGRGFLPDQRAGTGQDATYTSLPLFVRTLPENAFGSQVWQRNLLENYKKAISQDSTFKHLGSTAIAIGLGPDPDKGKEEIAGVLKGMVDNTTGWSWLRDLFKYGYGSYLDEVLIRSQTKDATPAAPTEDKRTNLPNGNSRKISGNSNGINGIGNEGRKLTEPRR